MPGNAGGAHLSHLRAAYDQLDWTELIFLVIKGVDLSRSGGTALLLTPRSESGEVLRPIRVLYPHLVLPTKSIQTFLP